jgi:hypothetical protein
VWTVAFQVKLQQPAVSPKGSSDPAHEAFVGFKAPGTSVGSRSNVLVVENSSSEAVLSAVTAASLAPTHLVVTTADVRPKA